MRTRPWLPWLMWGIGALCYLMALFHRMSLSVAGLTAQQRFGIDATGLAAFSVVQFALYALLQVPVGVGNDRLGPRKLLLGGMTLMAAGSVVLALATGYPAAMTGRALIGAGDACMFVSVLRIAQNWFPGNRYAFVAALTGMIGGLGQLVATAPLAALLQARGWTGAFLVAGAATVVLLVAAAAGLREAPRTEAGEATDVPSDGPREPLGESVRLAWRNRGTRHALFTHFTLMGSFVTFTAVLGQPYLVGAHRLSEGTAGALLAVVVVGFVVSSTAAGQLASRRPAARGGLVLAAVLLALGCSALLVALPAAAPAWVLAVVLAAIGVGGGVSMLAFDLARSANPGHRAGVASGLANMGGFTFAVVAQLGAGVLLDALLAAGVRDENAHRLAFGVPLALAVAGVIGVVRLRAHAGTPPAESSAREGGRSPGALTRV
ncbi:nitrate/nitrite transporter [Prauserella oleivorans]|uniref:Nitrate/nitrite transporter n=1 Tax=Prauserella oleivorans TaxID=1478153 RepID=A0ABW5WDC9_9PSEU